MSLEILAAKFRQTGVKSVFVTAIEALPGGGVVREIQLYDVAPLPNGGYSAPPLATMRIEGLTAEDIEVRLPAARA
jgi:hypothetical protein